jgi:prophage regulatory protein
VAAETQDTEILTEPPDVAMPVEGALLLRAVQAAALCGRSLRTWWVWDAAGLIPRPVRIGRSSLWRADELRSWVAAGCPRRGDWETRQP